MTPATIQMMRELKGFLLAGAVKAYPAASLHREGVPSCSEIVVHLSTGAEAFRHRAGLNDETARDFLASLLEVLAKNEEYCAELKERKAEFQTYGIQIWCGFSLRKRKRPQTVPTDGPVIDDRDFLRSCGISCEGLFPA